MHMKIMGVERMVDLTEEKKDGCKMNGRSERCI